jgi:tetratricopeptide (TPR) repeat protein
VRRIRTVVVCCWILIALNGAAVSQQPSDFESLLASAQQAQARGDFDAAAEFYRKAVILQPGIAEIRANLGLMYYQTGKDEQAIEAFRQAIQQKPDLFVPNLFLGLEYVKLKRFKDALPHVKRASLSNPTDMQAQLALAQAYAGLGKTRLATASYLRAVRIDPKNADSWFHLGVTYLEQVEADARVFLARHKDSAYFQSLMAETFAEQRAFIQAEVAYKKVLASPRFPPGVHAGYGLVLLNRHDLSGAERELRAEFALNPRSLTAKLGMARLDLEQGMTVQAVKEIEEIEKTDAGFLQANISLFSTGMSRAKQAELRRALEEGQASGNIMEEVLTVFRDFGTGGSFLGQTPERATVPTANRATQVPVGAAVKLYANGSYGECDDVLGSRLQQLPSKNLQLLAWCAYLSGNYSNSLQAGSKLASNPATEAEGLYWETKSAQKLATQALARASAADAGSPKLHVLLGDIYRQQKSFPDAELEYRKALASRPQDSGALFGLSLALLADGQNDEALNVAQAALQKNPDDPELNAVMGEILCVRDDFASAEPYLKKSLNAKPEFVSRVHALLGKVYAQTNRIQQAIVELKLALASDKDGSLHYQIARLYLKLGDPGSAKQAFEVSKRLQQEGLMHASVAMQQGENDSDSQ